MVTPEFIFDFGSPNAYLAHRAIPAIEARTGARFLYAPCLLGGIFKLTNNRSPMVANAGIRNKNEYEMLEMRRFIERHRIDSFRMNPHFPVNTLLIMRGALVAERSGRLADYVEAAMRGMWEEGAKMDDAETVAARLDAAGLDGQGVLAATGDPEIKAALLANTERAVERGAFGVPTFFVGEEMYFGKDRLDAVEEAILRSAAQEHPQG